ncbi:hypothetical protein A3195_12810 [Candidatus Thiodiazotropha endoloripes]|uniref:Uncharacterized protein n=1 Tax=Candidatus Thiodiazotropha endoloripes TaxID=1818881 RepID=A0A1E2USQ0_9GAMM|nr:hypothetical protein A3194_13785 [Candidatus Thiodiazotropha endoloripes]ODB86483.1 hypothetical protein A3195_12810 [Candidatus Thiodiazotropha endoloripes]ODB88512.1 hypothetical protein A3193_06595 [Candidatus Thiodiazotropha endoloripes]ODB97602.1 hypothetical protein A3196_13040 [Candidatus Thiodiazotropha endoloripes]
MFQDVGDDNLLIHLDFEYLNDLFWRTVFNEYSKFLSIIGVVLYFYSSLIPPVRLLLLVVDFV